MDIYLSLLTMHRSYPIGDLILYVIRELGLLQFCGLAILKGVVFTWLIPIIFVFSLKQGSSHLKVIRQDLEVKE